MPEKPNLNPKLQRLYELAKRLAKMKTEKARLEKALANWPTRKEQPQRELPN